MALCLTLRRDDRIVLTTSDGVIEIDLLEATSGTAASLAITAPRSVHIGRRWRSRAVPASPPLSIEALLTHAKGMD